MRNLTPEEEKKLVENMNTQYDELRKQINTAMKNQVWSALGMSTSSISPTDVDAKGRYEYQKPEQDEQGTLYGYKVLYYQNGELVSPRYPVIWNFNGTCRSDREPAERHMHGLHFTKRDNHPELKNYMMSNFYYQRTVLVKCALSGTVVETEQGFRAQHAQIIGVKIDGNWESYQDFQERARSYSRRVAEEREWRYIKDYNPTITSKWDTYYDPSADS